MALQVWLPLNRDLRNQGVSSATITNSGATLNNSGKIGSCYAFTSSQYMQINDIPFTKLTNCSVSFWFYLNEAESWLPCTGQSTSYYFMATSDNSGAFYHSSVGSNTKTIYRDGVVGTTPLSAGAWHHYCITGLDLSSWTTLYLNRYGSTGNSWNFAGRINDFRIYDTCLTPAKVKEISLGLVLHYKLDDINPINLIPFELTSSNYLQSNYQSRTSSSINNGVYHVDGYQGSNIDTSFAAISNSYLTLQSNTDYYLSFFCRGASDGDVYFGTSGQAYTGFIDSSNTHYYPSSSVVLGKGFAQWVSLKIHTGSNTQYKIFLGFDNPNLFGIGSYMEFSNVVVSLEKPDYYIPYNDGWNNVVCDSSGYGYHGTVNGNIAISINTGRYKCSANFTDSACSIGIGNLSTIITDGNFTFNVWFKKVTNEWSSKSWETIFGGPSGFEFQAKRGSTNSPVLVAYSWGQGGSGGQEYSLDTWNMVTMVRNTSNCKFYLNGELYYTGSAGSIPSWNYFIGSWKDTVSQNYRGYLSDVRLYSTVLSADDIKRLYNTGALVDKSGNVHSYEIDETDAGRELMITKWTYPFSSNTDPWIQFAHDGIYFDGAGQSVGCNYVDVFPTGKKYVYDYTISVAAGNQFYIGFERYDANKTARSNNACTYTYASKPSSDVVKQRYTGVVDLSTDGVNPCRYIRLRILNGWSGTDSSSTKKATVHKLSLREIPTSTDSKTRLLKTGVFQTDLLNELEANAKIEKNIDMNINEFIEI